MLDPNGEEVDDWLVQFGQYAVVIAAIGKGCRLVWHPAIQQQMTEAGQASLPPHRSSGPPSGQLCLQPVQQQSTACLEERLELVELIARQRGDGVLLAILRPVRRLCLQRRGPFGKG